MILPPIDIDLSGVIQEFSLNDNQAIQLGSSIIDRIAEEYTVRWEKLVNTELGQTKNEYKKAMIVERDSPLSVTFGLLERESAIAMMLEEGAPPFDEKIGFQRSSKIKQKIGGGWYLTIPFRHATPQAVAESGIFSSILPNEIYQIAKSKGIVTKKDLPAQYSTPGSRKEIRTPNLVVPEYMHKSPKYQGLMKVDVGVGQEKRSQYMTFRRVSDKSDPNSWWHKGLVSRKLMDKALEGSYIETSVNMVVDEFLKNL